MKKVIVGKKFQNDDYMFRETCFGIYYKDGKILVGIDNKRNNLTLIGGGCETDETKENTLKRELLPLQSLDNHYPKMLLTMDLDPQTNYDGIQKINVLDWLIE